MQRAPHREQLPDGPESIRPVYRQAVSESPATPPTDDKDWTWVIQQPCPECGYDPGTIPTEQIPDGLRRAAARWQLVLQRPDITLRPSPQVWSPLEYAAHVRDVYVIMGDRAELMLTESEPTFPNWDQDATALENRYWEADPATVAAEIAVAAERTAAVFGTVSPDQWDRNGFRSNSAVFTVRTLGIYCLHDLVHHLHDVSRR